MATIGLENPMLAQPAHSTQPAEAVPAIDFAAEFERCRRVLWTIAAAIVGRSTNADDVVQEAALLAFQKLKSFQPGTNFRAWMAQMVRFVALNQARRQQKQRATSLDGDAGETQVPMPAAPEKVGLRLVGKGELPAHQAEFDDRIIAALNTVAPIARACLLLRTIQQLEYSEIAALLEIPEGTAMSHVHRTRIHLRERLSALDPTRKEVRQ
jgi:RNA polymerase sigma-70 factor (ECF subfamily)